MEDFYSMSSSGNETLPKKKTYRMEPDVLKIVDQYAYAHHMSATDAVNELIRSAGAGAEQQSTGTQVAEEVVALWEQRYGSSLRRILSSTRFTDVNTEVIQLLVSTLCNMSGVQEADVKTGEALQRATELVKESIAVNKQKYDNKK